MLLYGIFLKCSKKYLLIINKLLSYILYCCQDIPFACLENTIIGEGQGRCLSGRGGQHYLPRACNH